MYSVPDCIAMHRPPSITIYTSECIVKYLTPTLIGTSGLFTILTLVHSHYNT